MKNILCTILLLSLIACSNTNTQQDKTPLVLTELVTSSQQQQSLSFPGKVKAAHDVSLSFRVAGAIEKFNLKEGEHFRKGDILVVMDPTDYQVQLSATQAEYQAVKSECERVIALHEDGVTTESDYEKAVSGLQQIEAKLKHHQDQVSYTKIVAPFDGYVQKKHFSAGEIVNAGMPVLSVISSDRPEVEINIPTSDYLKRDEFADAYCTFDFFPDRQFKLSSISITPKANSNQLHAMRFTLVDDEKNISAGMNTMVTILCNDQSISQLSVSKTSVFERDGRSYVYKLSGNKVSAKEVLIHKLLTNGKCIISSAQLQIGDTIISSGVHKLIDNQDVKPLNNDSKTNVGGLL